MMLSFLCLGKYQFPCTCTFNFHLCLFALVCSSQALLPGNEVAEIYHEMARKVTLLYNVYLVISVVYSDILVFIAEICAMLNFPQAFRAFHKIRYQAVSLVHIQSPNQHLD